MVLVENTIATGFDTIDKEPNVEIPREKLEEMQAWVKSCEFDNDDMSDKHREKKYEAFLIECDHHHETEDTVTIYHEDNIACLRSSNFINL